MKRMRDVAGMALLSGFFMVLGLTGLSQAEGDVYQVVGSYIETAVITASSAVPTAVMSASLKRPDALCANNGTSTVWISSMSAATHGSTPYAQTIGFPLTAGQSLAIGGKMTGPMYMNCADTVASCSIRCLYGLTR
jgi:hypothetical protein